MGIDKESDISANIQIGPTTEGMVRIYVEGEGFEIPLDFSPDEALEIAEELRAAAERAQEITPKKKKARPDRARPEGSAGRGARPPGKSPRR